MYNALWQLFVEYMSYLGRNTHYANIHPSSGNLEEPMQLSQSSMQLCPVCLAKQRANAIIGIGVRRISCYFLLANPVTTFRTFKSGGPLSASSKALNALV